MTQVARAMRPGQARKKSGLARSEQLWGYFFIAPWIMGFLAFTAIPILVSFVLSFTEYEIISPPRAVGLANYRDLLFNDRLFGLALYNTFYFTALSVPLINILGLGLAMLMNLKLRGVTLFRTLVYLPTIVPAVAASMLWVWLFNPQYGLLNWVLQSVGLPPLGWISDPTWSKPALVLMSLWGVGGTAIIYLAGLQGVPEQLYDAAAIDGANGFQQFVNVTVPMLSPVILFNLILGVISSFQVFTQAYIMTGGGPVDSTLFFALYLYRAAFQLLKMGYASAMAWVLFVIILLLTLLQFTLARRWVYYENR